MEDRERYILIPMPLDKDGDGPATEDNLTLTRAELWDSFSNGCLGHFVNIEAARFVVAALNFYDIKCLSE